MNFKYVDFGYKYHFIGHTPSESIEYIEIPNSNSNQFLKNTIILSDLNTFNNEHDDNCMWYSLKYFRSAERHRSKGLKDNIPILNTKL